MDNKAFISALAQQTGCDAGQITRLIEGFASVLRRECADCNKVAIPGFGTFEGEKKDETVSRDLVTGTQWLYPPCIEVKFTASAMLKKNLRENRR